MSLILEALKKSEAERQLGRAPGLTTAMPVRRQQHESPRLLQVLLSIALLLTAGVGLWWLLVPRTAAPGATGVAEVAEVAEIDLAPTPAEVARVTAVGAQNAGGAPTTRPAPTLSKPPLAAASPASTARQPMPAAMRDAAPTPHDPAFAATERGSMPVAAGAPPPAPPPVSQPAALPARVAAPAAVAPPVAVAQPAATTTVEVVPSDPTRTDPGGEALQDLPEPLPRLDQLGGPQRAALPPLKQTMHVYAEQPRERFVLIDGRRYREGDQVSASLQLAEIRRDGTVFVFDGLRFLLPRP